VGALGWKKLGKFQLFKVFKKGFRSCFLQRWTCWYLRYVFFQKCKLAGRVIMLCTVYRV
jgi:hypothetical protein